MVRIRPRLLVGLVLLTAVAGAGCGKKKPPTASNPDRTSDPGDSGSPGAGGGLPPRPALPTGWQEFKHPEGAYSIFVPGRPTRPKQSGTSLRLKQPFQPNEVRESVYEVGSSAKQPCSCRLELNVFHPTARVAYSAFEPGSGPPKLPANHTLTSHRTVNWGGLAATEMVVEKSFPGRTPERAYTVVRWALGPDRMYHFAIEWADRTPVEAERTAFFDSFVPGG